KRADQFVADALLQVGRQIGEIAPAALDMWRGLLQPALVAGQMHQRQHQGNDVGTVERLTQPALVEAGEPCLRDGACRHVLSSASPTAVPPEYGLRAGAATAVDAKL